MTPKIITVQQAVDKLLEITGYDLEAEIKEAIKDGKITEKRRKGAIYQSARPPIDTESLNQYFLQTHGFKPFDDSPPEQTAPEPIPSNDTLKESERDSLLKLVLGMAISKYGYNPQATKNAATGAKSGSIRSDIQSLGLDIDDETVRNYVKEAAVKFEKQLKTKPIEND